MQDKEPDTVSTDYRESHLSKGKDYDGNLRSAPLDAYIHKWEEKNLNTIMARLDKNKISRYLDFACGTGRITSIIAKYVDKANGVDISESMLETAREKHPSVNFIHADLTKEGTDLGTFDLVSSFRFFGNAQPELRDSALTTINKVLKKGGYFITNNHRTPNALVYKIQKARGSDQGLDLTHKLFKELLEKHGFAIETKRAIGFWILRPKWLNNVTENSRYDAILESIFHYRIFSPFSLDTIIVARKVSDI